MSDIGTASVSDVGTVLVCDDNNSHRYVMSQWLTRAGFDVVESTTGAGALNYARTHPELDVAILDVMLPDTSGLDVSQQLRSWQETTDLAILQVSATAIDVASRARGLDQGADAYLTEPLDQIEFLATVRSLARSRRARREAEQIADRLRRVIAATTPVNAADTVTSLLEAVTLGAADVFGLPAIATSRFDELRTARVLCPGPGQGTIIDMEGVPLTPFAESGLTLILADEAPPGWARLLDQSEVETDLWHAAPLNDRQGATIGGVAVALRAGSVPSDLDRRMLKQLADSMSVALSNLEAFTVERDIALTLQRSLLPDRLPDGPPAKVAARYIASTDHLRVGGDFYDAFELSTGETALLIGDVQGHSLQAATVMAELRFSLRAYLHELHDPARSLMLTNEVLVAAHPDYTATAAVAVIDHCTGRMRFANAGHLPPMMSTGSGVSDLAGHGPLLGVTGKIIPLTECSFEEGTRLVFFTDGLVERRGVHIDDSLDFLRGVVDESAELHPEYAADHILNACLTMSRQDDIALMLVDLTR